MSARSLRSVPDWPRTPDGRFAPRNGNTITYPAPVFPDNYDDQAAVVAAWKANAEAYAAAMAATTEAYGWPSSYDEPAAWEEAQAAAYRERTAALEATSTFPPLPQRTGTGYWRPPALDAAGALPEVAQATSGRYSRAHDEEDTRPAQKLSRIRLRRHGMKGADK